MPPTTTTYPCTHCAKPTTNLCSIRSTEPIIIVSEPLTKTSYCPASCQKADWPSRKDLCRRLQTRRQIYRVGAVLQAIFYVYREKVFNKHIVKVEKQGSFSRMWDGGIGNPIADFDMLLKFPREMFDNLEETSKQAALVARAGREAVAWMRHAVNFLISKIAETIEELTIEAKNPKLSVLVVHGPDTVEVADKQRLLKVKLKNGGEEYALDLASAKYGYSNPVRYLKPTEERAVEGGLVRINKQIGEVIAISLRKIEKGQNLEFANLEKIVQFGFEQLIKDVAMYTGMTIHTLLNPMEKTCEEERVKLGLGEGQWV
ncbi:hypothetical protein BDZ45DRAFT_800687 [Acephala macrosclerotiorum]|nr:hypothetical protein BDZ45DRAFT_800687 [Acephala macrosclerotiorum]